MTENMSGLGEINEWPNGYAMTLGLHRVQGVVTCCSGHATTEDAKNHGLARLVEIASAVGTRDVAVWAEREVSS